jgi:hypothetical protein
VIKTVAAVVLPLVLLLGAQARAQDTPPAEPRVQPVVEAGQVGDIEHQLQRGLDRLGGGASITRCGPVLALITPGTGGFDRSFGASCELKVGDRSMSALMCDDARGGRFTLGLAVVPDVEAMRRFILGNCFSPG